MSNALNDKIHDIVDPIIEQAKTALTGSKMSFASAWKIFQEGIANVVEEIEKFATVETGAEKKTAAMIALEKFYDSIIAPLTIQPAWLRIILSPVLRTIFLAFGSGAIDGLVATFRKVGVFKTSTQQTS